MAKQEFTKILGLLLCLLVSMAGKAQQRDWEKYLDDLTSATGADDNEITYSEDMFDILSELESNPININTATREELEQIPFLSDQQIEDIIAYVYQSNGMKTTSELALIESLDPTRRKLLTYFIYIGEEKPDKFPKLKDILKYGKHDITATVKFPFYDRKGDKNGYLGPKYRHSLRYVFSYGRYVKIGLQGSQDAGEPFFADKNGLGYDHYSWFITLNNLGRLKSLAIGQYKLRFGMGLVANSDFGFGKMMTLNSLGRSTNSLRGNTSRSIANYFQGVAATVNIVKGLDVTAFFSYRPIDATLNKAGNIQTILKNGYHRSELEMKKKNNADQMAAGGNLRWQKNGFHIGLTGVYSSLSKKLEPNTQQAYRKYYPSGKNFWNASVDYGYVSHRLSVNGETATGKENGIATINSISFNATSNLALIALQRFYSKRYSSLFAQSFSDGGHIQNESGLYVGANWQALSSLNVMFYTDYAYFAQPRYQASLSSHSWDNAVTLTFSRNNWTAVGRYRIRVREKDNEQKTKLINEITQRGRLSAGYDNGKWGARLQGDLAYSKYKVNSTGWMLSATGHVCLWRLNIAGTFGYFNTDDYNSRIYSYERGPLYNFYFPSFYGEGIRYGVFVRADLLKQLMIIGKFSTTDYFDRDHISSGLQQIDRSSQPEAEVQIRWKF